MFMDVRPIEMLHIVNKAIEVSKIQSENQNYYVNMQQSAVLEEKIEMERRKERVNRFNNLPADDKVSPDGKRQQDHRSFQKHSEGDEKDDKKTSPMKSRIDIMI